MNIPGFASLRRRWHNTKDSWFTRDLADKLTIGTEDRWTVCGRLLEPRLGPILSAGVGQDMTFELILARECGMTVLLFDPSPIGRETAGKPENLDSRIRFSPVGWVGHSGGLALADPENLEGKTYSLPRKVSMTSCKFPCLRVSEIMRNEGISVCPLLKMDIEGFEYDVLDDILDSKLDIRQICLEFHHFLRGVSLLRTYRALWRLRRAGYVAFHKTFCEYSFIRRDILDKI